MYFNGFQKMTLLDFPGRVACTLFTGGCNLRCPFCHNALLVTELTEAEQYDPEDILSFLKKRVGLLDGVAVTGGEPLLHPELPRFLAQVKALGYAVKLDTNGCFPERLENVLREGLVDYVAMDIKNAPEKYAETVGIPTFDISPVKQSVSLLLSNRVDYEFRTTVVREFHTPEDFEAIGKWISGAKRYFLQNFVDSGNLIGHDMHPAEKDEMLKMASVCRSYVTSVQIRGL